MFLNIQEIYVYAQISSKSFQFKSFITVMVFKKPSASSVAT